MNRKPLEVNKFVGWDVGVEYKLIKMLGQGAYGAVASATHLPSGKKVAIKRMEGIFEDETDCKRILREIHILKSLKSPAVVGLFDMIPPTDPENFSTIYVVL
jgi:mitogen-activated protein kinase 1/3